MSRYTSAASVAVDRYPLPRGSQGGTNTLPTPPGGGLPLVSDGSAPGNYYWQQPTVLTSGTYAITAGEATTANTTAGNVTLNLPALASVPLGCQIPWFLGVSTGAHALILNPAGADNLMNYDTGAYANTPWSTAPSGNQQGRGGYVEASAAGWEAH